MFFHSKNIKLIIAFFFLVSLIIIKTNTILADACDNPEKIDSLPQLEECKNRAQGVFNLISKANSTNKANLKILQQKVNALKTQLDGLSFQLDKKQKEINRRNADFDQKYEDLSKAVRSFYIKSYYPNLIAIMVASDDAYEALRLVLMYTFLSKQNRNAIVNLVTELASLQKEKNQLAKILEQILVLKAQVDEKAGFLAQEVAKASAYEKQLQSQIARLSQRQQNIIAQRQQSLNLPTSLGAGPLFCTDDRKLDPGFSPAFAFFTFGIPHRVGLNQYGAYGRAKADKKYKEILEAYFQNISFEKTDNIHISVQGYGSMPIEQYLLGIYEMPGDWPIEALKAQVVAARSYALAYTNRGQKEICTTQSCQVYKGGNKGGNWESAVKATEGEYLSSGGQPISAWYSSTDGGYTFSSSDVGWGERQYTKRQRDTNGDINSFSDLFEKAYDKDSPCFYSAQGYRNEYNKSAWLKTDEVADIINVIMLMQKDSGVSSHLYQIDKPNPEGVETWNKEKVKEELKNRGGVPFHSVSDFSIDWDKGSGMVTGVRVTGDGNSINFNGSEFKNFFNLRAPANIQIVGPLFNVEKKQ
jgi:SpoIID/LytB domain protein